MLQILIEVTLSFLLLSVVFLLVLVKRYVSIMESELDDLYKQHDEMVGTLNSCISMIDDMRIYLKIPEEVDSEDQEKK